MYTTVLAGRVIAREVRVIDVAVEGKLQHPGSGISNWSRSVDTSGVIRPRSSAMNGRGPGSVWTAEIGPGRNPFQFGRSALPLAHARRPRAAEDGPGGSRQRGPTGRAGGRCTRDRAGLPKSLPIIDGCPELPLRAEVVGWRSRPQARATRIVERERTPG